MPRIPRLDLNGRSRIAPVSAPRAAPGKFGSLGGTISELGDALLHIEDSVRKVATLHQVTKATTDANREIMKTQDEALLDPDLDTNLPKYQQRIRQIAEESVGRVSDPLARMELQGNLSTRLTALDLHLVTEARQTLGRKALEELGFSLNDAREAFHRAPNEAAKQEILVQTEQTINDYVAAGVMTPIDGRKQIASLNDDLREFDFTRRIEIGDAEAVLQAIDAGQHGLRDAKTVEQVRKAAETKFAQQIVEGRVHLSDLHDANEVKAMQLLVDGQLVPSVLASMEGRQDITPQFRDALEDNLLSPHRFITDDEADLAVYHDLFKEVYRTKRVREAERTGKEGTIPREAQPKSDVRTLMRNIIRANTQGKISVNQMRRLSVPIQAEFQQAATRSRHSLFGGIINTFADWFSGRDEAAIRHSLELIDRVERGEVKPEEVPEAIRGALRRDLIERHPGLALQERLPDAVRDERGVLVPTGVEKSTATPAIRYERDKDGRYIRVK